MRKHDGCLHYRHIGHNPTRWGCFDGEDRFLAWAERLEDGKWLWYIEGPIQMPQGTESSLERVLRAMQKVLTDS